LIREQSPRSDVVVLEVAERWFLRGRVVATAATGVLGVVAALGMAPLAATPLLVLALIFAASMLASSLLARHTDVAPFVRFALAVTIDVAAWLGAAPSMGPLAPSIRLIAAALAGAALAVTIGAACSRLGERDGEAAAPSAAAIEPWLVALADAVAAGVREPLGIVRARAEIIRLAVAEDPRLAGLAHDAEVLLARADEAQHALLALFALAPTARGEVDLEKVAADELGVHPLAGRVALLRARPPAPIVASHDEAALLVRRLLDVAAALSAARGTLRLRLRAAGGGADVTLRFPLASASRLRELDEGRVDPRSGGVASGLALVLARRVARRLGGELALRQVDRQGELRLLLPGREPLDRAEPARATALGPDGAPAPGDKLARIPAAP
jgi:hypothetical protein